MKIFILLLSIFSALVCLPVSALEIRSDFEKNTALIHLSGEFLPGDYSKFSRAVLKANEEATDVIVLINSPGGSTSEAERIGNLIRDLGYSVDVEEDGICASACFLVYALATSRGALSGKVIVHRPYFKSRFYDENNTDQAMAAHRVAINKFRQILMNAAIPADIVDLAVSRSSDDSYVLSKDQLSRIGISPPWVEELLISKCGYKAALVREATFNNTLPYEARSQLMVHRGKVFGGCWNQLNRQNHERALNNLRNEFEK